MPKVTHERWKCIGCGACAAVAADFWEMSDDGKALMKMEHKVTKTGDGELHEAEIKEEQAAPNEEAADVCPVKCIHLEK